MRGDSEHISDLRMRVEAAREELDVATMFHEAWKPTAYDGELHDRMHESYSGHTFQLIRMALRRETVMALMRVWDNDPSAVNLRFIAAELTRQTLQGLADKRGMPEDRGKRSVDPTLHGTAMV